MEDWLGEILVVVLTVLAVALACLTGFLVGYQTARPVFRPEPEGPGSEICPSALPEAGKTVLELEVGRRRS